MNERKRRQKAGATPDWRERWVRPRKFLASHKIKFIVLAALLSLCVVLFFLWLLNCESIFSWAWWGKPGVRNVGLLLAGAIGLGLGAWRASTANKQAKAALEQVKLTERGHNIDRYQKSAAMLGDKATVVRQAGIYSLQQVAMAAPDEYFSMVEKVLISFASEDSKRLHENADTCETVGEDKPAPPADIQAVIRAVLELAKFAHDRNIPSRHKRMFSEDNPVYSYRCDLRGIKLDGIELNFIYLTDVDLSGAKLNEVKLRKANLRRTKLRNTELSFANLPSADLANAKLRDAKLNSAILSGADLSRANLYDAKLHKANLNGAKLKNAKLTSAKLNNTFLMRADLTDAVLDNADLTGANISSANFTGARGLNQAQLDDAWCWDDMLPRGLDTFNPQLEMKPHNIYPAERCQEYERDIGYSFLDHMVYGRPNLPPVGENPEGTGS